MKRIIFAFFCFSATAVLSAQVSLDSILPIRGLTLSAPSPAGVDKFVSFINTELVPRKVNTLLFLIGYRYQYKSHPEVVAENALSESDIKKIVSACKAGKIRLIPQINFLGHQSSADKLGPLLKAYPHFTETPWIPSRTDSSTVKWPNEWGLYAFSYCPLHPDVHKVVFEVMDELMEVCEADAFHSGMDEVFYLGEEKCPRCQGRDHADLFAGEVTAIRNRLASKNRELWIWGDRLIDGKATGVGYWEGSYNNTSRAIDLIPKDVVICDWHYERADPTAVLFATKGFRVVTCPWRHTDVTLQQLKFMVDFRNSATPETKNNYQGMLHTTWTGGDDFIDQFYGRKEVNTRRGGNYVEAFKALFDRMNMMGK